MTAPSDLFLLAIRGDLKPTSLDEARTVHNQTAGNPQGVAAARALGDLSHNVYVPIGDAPSAATELLILDTWTSVEGLGTFFSDPQVQGGGGMIFKTRDPVVWVQDSAYSFSLPAPKNRTARYVGVIRGTVKSREAAHAVFDRAGRASMQPARMLGQVSHHVYFRATQPGEPASTELLGVDVWHDADGMAKFYSNVEGMAASGIYDVFAGKPATSVWKQPAGEWVEW